MFQKENVYAYYYDLPFEETLKRHEKKRNKFDFGEEDMRRWWNEKDYLGFIREKIFTEEVTLEDAVKIIVSDVEKKELNDYGNGKVHEKCN